MPSPTYTAIAKTVLTGTQATITFNSIPGTYTDLLLVFSARNDRTGVAVSSARLYFNGETSGSATTYSYTSLEVTGTSSSTVGSQRASNSWGISDMYIDTDANTASTFASAELYIPNYAGSTNKVISTSHTMEQNGAYTYKGVQAGLWRNTNAITRIDIDAGGYNFVSGSRFDLYGIKNS